MNKLFDRDLFLRFVQGDACLPDLAEAGIRPTFINGVISWKEPYCPFPIKIVKQDLAKGILKQNSTDDAVMWAKIIIGSGFIEFAREDDESDKLWETLWDIAEEGITPSQRQFAEMILKT